MLYPANQLYQQAGAAESLGLPTASGPFDFKKTVRRLFNQFVIWHKRAKGRRRLAQLDARMLRDIGIDRAAAQAEASKPFWVL